MLVLRSRVGRVDAVAFSPDGSLLAVGGTNGLELWSVHRHERLWRWDDPSGLRNVRQFHFGRDGWLLAKLHGLILLFDPATGQHLELGFPYSDDSSIYWAVDPTTDQIAVASHGRIGSWRFEVDEFNNLFPYQRVVVWDFPISHHSSGEMLFRRPPGESNSELWSLNLNHWEIRDVRHGDLLQNRRTSSSRGHLLIHDPNDEYIIGLHGEWLMVWSLKDLRNPLRINKQDNRRQFTGLALHPSGQYLATASNDRAIRLWEMNTWRPVRHFEWKAGRMRSIAFAPDGLIAAAGGELGEFVLFDVEL